MFAPPIAKHQAPAAPRLQRKCACGSSCRNCPAEKDDLQRKLAIGSSNDPLEHEADRVAEQVLAMRGPSDFSRVPLSIQRLAPGPAPGGQQAPASVDRVLASPGRPLDAPVRRDMEARFGHDFSQVRVHDGTAAAQSAREVGARAYAVGSQIVFGAGEYSVGSQAGRRLIAHELTHVVQQGASAGAVGSVVRRLPVGGPDGSRPGAGGGTLPYREATELADCIRIMGDPEYCRQEVLGEPATPCPLSITGPTEVDHYCAAYVPSNAASCGVFPAPNVTLTVQGSAPGAALAWSIEGGATRASIVGPANGLTAAIKGDAASAQRGDVTVRVSNGACSARHRITVREPSSLTAVASNSSATPARIETTLTYTVRDQFRNAMGAGICIDETITICSSSHPFTPFFRDAATNAQGEAQDNLWVNIPAGAGPFCFKLNQSITAGGCGPLLNNTITYRPAPAGITLGRGATCVDGDPCP